METTQFDYDVRDDIPIPERVREEDGGRKTSCKEFAHAMDGTEIGVCVCALARIQVSRT